MVPEPYRSERPVPLFPTQHELVSFIRDSIASGRLKDCAHLRWGDFNPRYLVEGPGGYGPVCARDSFRTVDRRWGEYDFYGCPPDCLLFDVQCQNTPWSRVTQKARPRTESGAASSDTAASSGVVRAAKITAAATIIAALIGAGWWTTKGRDNAAVEVKQTASAVETQQSQTQSTSGTGTGIQAGRDVNIYQAPPPPSPPSMPILRSGPISLDEVRTALSLKTPAKDAPFVAYTLNGLGEYKVNLGRRYAYLFFDPPKKHVTKLDLPMILKLDGGGELTVKAFSGPEVVLEAPKPVSASLRIFPLD